MAMKTLMIMLYLKENMPRIYDIALLVLVPRGGSSSSKGPGVDDFRIQSKEPRSRYLTIS